MKAPITMTLMIALGGVSAAPPTRAGDMDAPLTFHATRGGDRNYSLNWGLRLAESVPVKTGLRIGLAASPEGRIADLPLRVTAGIGNLDDATAAVRRSIELAVGQEGEGGGASLTAQRVRPVHVTADLDAELRQTVSTGLRAASSRVVGEVRASQSLVLNDILPRTSMRATATLSSAEKGLAAQFRVERRLARSLSISADLSHDATANKARLGARYALSW